MSVKKGLSSTLRNLKFMQRAAVAQKVEEKSDAEVEMETEVEMAKGGRGRLIGLGCQEVVWGFVERLGSSHLSL